MSSRRRHRISSRTPGIIEPQTFLPNQEGHGRSLVTYLSTRQAFHVRSLHNFLIALQVATCCAGRLSRPYSLRRIFAPTERILALQELSKKSVNTATELFPNQSLPGQMGCTPFSAKHLAHRASY